MHLPQRLDALRDRNYRLIFTGQLLSQVGDQMTPVAITFAILDRGGSARQVGLVLGAGTASMVIFLLLGGAVADWLSRRIVMMTADLLRFVAQGIVAALLLSGHWQVWELAVLEVFWGAGAAFFFPALTGLLPEVLSGDSLNQGNALQGFLSSAGNVVGPGLAGVLVAAGGVGSAVAVDAASFAVSALCLARRVRLPVRSGTKRERTSILSDLADGWTEFSSRRWLWGIVAEFGLLNLLVFAPFIVLGAVVAKIHLGGAPAWGLLLSAFGVGGLIGGLVSLDWRPKHPLLVGTLATLGFVPLLALLAVAAPVAVLAPMAFVAGAGLVIFDVQWNTTLQRQIPHDVLSRVSSYDWLGSFGLLPVGYVIAGPIAAVIGIRMALLGSCLLDVGLIGAVLLLPEVRNMTAERFDQAWE